MARKRNPDSTLTFGALQLDAKEEKELKARLKVKKWSLAKLKKMLIREWINKPLV